MVALRRKKEKEEEEPPEKTKNLLLNNARNKFFQIQKSFFRGIQKYNKYTFVFHRSRKSMRAQTQNEKIKKVVTLFVICEYKYRAHMHRSNWVEIKEGKKRGPPTLCPKPNVLKKIANNPQKSRKIALKHIKCLNQL
jgi:hypothetical protein